MLGMLHLCPVLGADYSDLDIIRAIRDECWAEKCFFCAKCQ
jgi:hypothetical protein